MTTQLIVLNGGSSSGKSAICRCLQALLPEDWLTLGVDTLIQAMPLRSQASDAGIKLTADGRVLVGPTFRALELAWIAGIASMARAGAKVIVDEVFLSGGKSQRRWQQAVDGLAVLWVGVRCDAEIATQREAARGDRVAGQAAAQATVVHRGVRYDLEVDTSYVGAMECARAIAARLS